MPEYSLVDGVGRYNWYAVTAGSGKYSQPTATNASDSICPNGWRLPTGRTSSGDYSKLSVAYGGTGTYDSYTETARVATKGLMGHPANFANGNTWSSTSSASGVEYAYNFDIVRERINPGSYGLNAKSNLYKGICTKQ